MRIRTLMMGVGMAGVVLATAQAAYIIQIDIDGDAGNSAVTLNPDFSYGGDTTTASASSASGAFGLEPGNSIFGGNGVAMPDTYVFAYSPDSQADNLVIAPGTDLGDGNVASGLVGGAAGRYSVYATWPFTTNVSGGVTNFLVETPGDSFMVAIDQNAGGEGSGDAWFRLGDIDYTSGAITVTQTATTNAFVSMRSAGALFESIPEPATPLMLLGVVAFALVGCRRR